MALEGVDDDAAAEAIFWAMIGAEAKAEGAGAAGAGAGAGAGAAAGAVGPHPGQAGAAGRLGREEGSAEHTVSLEAFCEYLKAAEVAAGTDMGATLAADEAEGALAMREVRGPFLAPLRSQQRNHPHARS